VPHKRANELEHKPLNMPLNKPLNKPLSKRAALLDAAKHLLWERGYEAMSPRDVLDRSGVGHGALYHHFTGKQALALAALEEIAAEEMHALDQIFLGRLPPLQRIRGYLRRERSALRGCRLARLANESAIESQAFRQPIEAFLEHIATHLQACIKAAQQDGTLAGNLNAAAIAAALVAVIEGGFVMARVYWEPAKMRLAVEGALQLLDSVSTEPRGAG
jgi:TetR/AcrR family transcriptional repressor of nem operon